MGGLIIFGRCPHLIKSPPPVQACRGCCTTERLGIINSVCTIYIDLRYIEQKKEMAV